jgi:hypothetical protein
VQATAMQAVNESEASIPARDDNAREERQKL